MKFYFIIKSEVVTTGCFLVLRKVLIMPKMMEMQQFYVPKINILELFPKYIRQIFLK